VKIVYWTLLLLVGFLVAGLAGFWLAARPPRLMISLRPRDYKLSAEEVVITADDGIRLSAWFIPRAGAPGLILLHGYPAEKADLLPLAAALHRDFAVLLVDLRYFGGSGGHMTTLGLRERSDLRRAVDFLIGRGISRVGVFGFSLGGAVALLAAVEDERIRAVAAYAPFSDLRVLGRELYAYLWLLKYPLVETMILWGRLCAGGDLSRPSPVAAARALAIPVLLVASRTDEQISFRHAERLREALRGNPAAEFSFGDYGRHGELGPELEARIRRFFLEHLGAPRPQARLPATADG
jgi:dipeptidyl aminopeptidase/acylaminoacyl peptidase